MRRVSAIRPWAPSWRPTPIAYTPTRLDERLAALLGVESLRRADTVQGFEALWNASHGMGQPVAWLPEAGDLLTFSPDGMLVASGSRQSETGFVRVFEARSGRRLAQLGRAGARERPGVQRGQ